MPGFELKWFKDQQEGIQLISAMNAQKANRTGLPNHDTERRVLRRAKWRAARYEIESEGFGSYLKRRLSGKRAVSDKDD